MMYYFMRKGGDVPDLIKQWVGFCFRADKMKPHLHGMVASMEEEDFAAPVNDADAQCEMCGHSCVTAKYHVVSGKMKGVGMCCECVAAFGLGKKAAKVPLFTTAVARVMGLDV